MIRGSPRRARSTAIRTVSTFLPTAPTSAVTAALTAVRQRTLDLVSHLGTADLERQIDPILSPLVWDLGHIAAYEDLWLVHRHAGHTVLHADLSGHYDAFETPRAVRGDLEILGHADSLRYLDDVRERTLAAITSHGVDPVVHEMVLRHELQHTETMRQAMEVAGLLPPGVPSLPALSGDPADPSGGWLEVPAGAFTMGAHPGVFSYDNERPRHTVHVDAFRIARRPVTNASWLTFTEGGGYVRREWWSDEGWAWKEDQDINGDHARADGAPDAPVCHVSWFEADAFARSHGTRLPTEAEWEKAATWTQGEHAPLEGLGLTWEWTASAFGPYPGFVAHPYREYSEVFFGQGHRVLRGGSWAAHPRVATRTFRNWDLPQRSQIFSGVRLAAGADVPLPTPRS
ncbi:MAG: egtB [Solirubrobacterales bacterium]|nr:egtB [Solirubrobacterales bacterium]